MMKPLIMLMGMLYLSPSTRCHRYDNTQHGTGENVVLDMEDVLVIAIDDSESYSTDYYDYSDLTVKPEEDMSSSTPSTAEPSSTPVSEVASKTPQPADQNPTSPSSEIIKDENNNVTAAVGVAGHPEPNLPETSQSGEPQHPLNTENMQIPVHIITDQKKKGYISSSSIRRKQPNSPSVDVEALPKRTCSPGFALDEKNRCKRIRKPLLAKHRPPLPYGLHYPKKSASDPTSESESS